MRKAGWTAGLALLVCVACADGQTLLLQDGKTIPVTRMRRTGDSVLVPVQIGATTGELGYAVNSIVRADFPEPAALATATALIAQGKANEAVAQLSPVLDFFQPIAEVPGSWWTRLALLKAEALEKAGRGADAEAILQQVTRTTKDTTMVEIARLRLARPLIAQGKYADAIALGDAALEKHPDDGEIAANVWLIKGDALFAQRQFEPALLAYLHVPALYGKQTAAMPPALLGSARAYLGLHDRKRGADALTELTHDFSSSAEAKIAAEELKRIAEPEPDKKP